MYKLLKISLFFLIFMVFSISNAQDILIKGNSEGEETYRDTGLNFSTNTTLNFQFSSNNTGTYRVSFPSGFEYQNNYSTGAVCGGFNKINSTNSNFEFNYNSGPCVVNFDYEAISAGNKTITLYKGTGINTENIKSIDLNIISDISIIKAETIDSNSNGYLDQIKLIFSSDLNLKDFEKTNFTVGGQNPSSITNSGSEVILNINDNTFNSGDRPAISFDGITGVSDFSNIQAEDKTKPVLWEIDGQSVSSNSNIEIGSGSINARFSEPMNPTSTGAFSIKKDDNNISGTFSFNSSNNILTFIPNSSLSAGEYIFTSNSNAIDYSSNFNILDQTILTLIVSDSESPIGKQIGTSTGISINSGAASTNNKSVQLQLLATDNIGVTEMCISNTILNQDNTCSNWETYSTSKNNWNLLDNAGTKTVYVKFKDSKGNISPVYNDIIEYEISPIYLTFDSIESMYTDNSSIELSGACSSGNESWNSFSGSVNNSGTGNIDCINNKWSNTFNITSNQENIIKIFKDTLENSITIINPIPTCPNITNGTSDNNYPNCSFTCNIGYDKVGSSCQLKNKFISNYSTIYNTSTYNFSDFTLYYNSPQTKISSNEISKNNGKFKLQQIFTLSNDGVTVTYSGQSEILQTCNTGYQVSGNSCIAISSGSSGGGGGGSYTPTCNSSHLICSEYLGEYIWQRKSGVSCSGGDLGKACSTEGGSSGGIIQTDNIFEKKLKDKELIKLISGYISENNIIKKELITTYLKDLFPERFEKIVSDYAEKIPNGNMEYFITFDNELENNYYELLISYSNLFSSINELLNKNPNTEKIREDAISSLINYKKLTQELKQAEKRYVEIVKEDNDIIYRTKNNNISELLEKIEKLILNKYKLLLSSNTITKQSYDDYLKTYNDFVLYYTINKTFNDKTAGKEAVIKIKEVIKIYKKEIKEQEETKRVKDEYSLNIDLKYKDYNNDVTSLQSILKHFGYFPFEPSGYFGNSTLEYIKKFTKEKLDITFSGVVDSNLRQLILDLEL